jgi:hypothetical protein
MKKLTILVNILFLSINTNFSQTYITPIFGVEYFNIIDKYIPPNNVNTIFYSTPKETETVHYGVAVTKMVSKDYSLRMTINYSKTSEAMWERGAIHITNGIRFQTIKNSLQLTRKFLGFLDLSAGLGLNIFFDFKNISPYPINYLDKTKINGRIFDPGLTFGLGLSKWGVICDFHFYQGVFTHKIWNYNVRPIQIWRLSLGYEFKF